MIRSVLKECWNALLLRLRNSEQRSWRQMIIDGEPFDFTNGFTDLHTKSYEEILAGRGFGLQEALPAVSLCESIRRTKG